MSWWAIAVLAGTGCDSLLGKEPNPGYCGSATCPPDGGGCRSNADCTSPGAGVCDVVASQCVQCTATDHAACTGTTPFCGTNDACRACASHGECASQACVSADGSCAVEADVAYVDAMATGNATCGISTPCASIAAALMTGRPYVKVHGTISGAVVVDGGRTVTFLADPGASLTRGSGGDVVTVKDAGTSLAIFDLAISGAQGPGVGISVAAGATLSMMRVTVSSNDGGGISSAGSITIDHSIVTDNGPGGPGIVITAGSLNLARSLISANRRGGVSVVGSSAMFAIVSNKFVGNGSPDPGGSSTGAVSIGADFASTNLLEFNTFYRNLSSDGVGPAIKCDPMKFTARNNIMFNNGPAGNVDQNSGSCAHVYSIAMPGTPLVGAGDLFADPLFVDPTSGDFHLKAMSPAIGAADPSTSLTGLAAKDFDDRPRMIPVNLGAYQ